MKLAVVLNPAGGTLKNLDADQVAADAAAAFAAAGHEVECSVAPPDDLRKKLEDCAKDKSFDAVVVGGGDGTISTAAAVLAGSGVALGVLPLGTLNLFARSLAVPIDLEQALAALATGETRLVDIAEVNGIRFTNHVSLGLHPRIIRLREAAGYASRLGKMLGDLKAWLRTIRRPPRLDITMHIDGRSVRRRTSLAVVANNPFGEGLGHLPHTDDPAGGRLAVYISGALGHAELWHMSGQAMLGQWLDNPKLETMVCRDVRIAVRGRAVATASVDGELVRLDQPMAFRSLPGILKVIAPAKDAAAASAA